MTRKRKRPEREKVQQEGMQLLNLRTLEITGGMIRSRAAQTPQELAQLVSSIARHGLLSPLVVCREDGASGYRLVCGARRLAACRLLGMSTVPALLIDADAAQAAACFMEEHLCRETPCTLDEAQMIELSGGMETAKESALSESVFSRRLALLDLDEGTKHIAKAGGLSLAQAEPLLSIARDDWRQEAAQMIADRRLSGAQARRLVFGPRAADDRAPVMTGRRRALQAAWQEIDRLRNRLRAQGVDAEVSVLSRGEGLCVQLTFGRKQNAAEQEKSGGDANTSLQKVYAKEQQR